MDLIEFLLARYDEDEAASQVGPEPENWCDRAEGYHYEHARVLAEVAAHRRIVAEHPSGRESYLLGTVCDTCCVWGEADYEGPPEVAWPCATLRALASVYADHPDYDPQWAPGS